MFYYLSTLGVENGDESARFPMFWKRIDQRSSPLPLSSPLPFSFLPPIFPGKRRKTNWAVEPLEFSICPKLTPELSRPPRFRSFSEFLVSLSFFFSSFLSSPAEEPKPNISARFIPSEKGEGGGTYFAG